MYYLPPSIYFGEKIGELICGLLGLAFKIAWLIIYWGAYAVYYGVFAILKVLEWIFKLFCLVLPKIEDLIVYGYRRFRKYREERYYVK